MSLLKKSAQKSEFTQKKCSKKEIHSKKLLKRAAQTSQLTKKITEKRTKKLELFFTRSNMYYSRTLTDEAIYYTTIYPNSRDLGTAE